MRLLERSRVMDEISVQEVLHPKLLRAVEEPLDLRDNFVALLRLKLARLGKLLESDQNLVSRHQFVGSVPEHRVVTFLAPEAEIFVPAVTIPEVAVIAAIFS